MKKFNTFDFRAAKFRLNKTCKAKWLKVCISRSQNMDVEYKHCEILIISKQMLMVSQFLNLNFHFY